MPRARSTPPSRSGGTTRKTGAKSSGTRAKASTSRASTAKRSSSTAKRSTAASKSSADFSGKSVAELRSALKGGVITPLNLVMLTRERIEEVLEDAVSRGRVTSSDAQKLTTDLVARGRKQTNEVLRDLEDLLNKRSTTARKRGAQAASRARKQVGQATARARTAADPVLARADRVRRTAGVGPSFPITGYDDLSVAQVEKRLGGLKPAELRKVRDYERRHANRKGILTAIERRLA